MRPQGAPQVPPLRFAPVGMTILSQVLSFLAEALAAITKLSSRPERSVVDLRFSHTRFSVP
jgi:hypothetical protein